MIGTRPEAIKLSPVADALAARRLTPSIIFTGQHADLNPHEFGLGSFPRRHLNCPGEEDPHAHVRRVTAAVLPLLRRAPDLLLVQGDTSSALAGALAASTAGVPVAHVEAGLRTGDPLQPWPEEEYRAAIDAQSDLLFAPTPAAAANLASEGVRGEVHVTGNSGIDALRTAVARLPARTVRERSVPRILVTCHRRESWGEGLQSIASAVTTLANHGNRVDVILHPNDFLAAALRTLIGYAPRVALIAPCRHGELLRRMRDADLVLSDSGGIQEEAPGLGVPLLVLRNKTERPEGIANGNARLVGTSAERIVAETRALLSDDAALAAMRQPSFPYGDGKAAQRMAAIIEDWLERRGTLSPKSSAAGRTAEF